MSSIRKEEELNQLFDELSHLLEETSENLKEKQPDKLLIDRKNETKQVDGKSISKYKRATGPSVISVEEYQRRVENGEFKDVVTISHEKNSKKKEKDKVTLKKPKDEEKPKEENNTKHRRKIAEISKILQRNTEHELRFTESKKRNLLSRIILQEKLAKGHYCDLEDDIKTGYITKEDVDYSKTGKKLRERKLYKEVQSYEDAKEDVSLRKGWNPFKVSLAGVALAGVIALSAYTYKEFNDSFKDFGGRIEIVSVQDLEEDERIIVESEAQKIKKEIIEKAGYHFNNISDDEFLEGYYRILSYEKKMNKRRLENTISGFVQNKDQELLETIVEESFNEEYINFSEEKKRDYKQLAFELLSYSHPEKTYHIRNPIVIDELDVKKGLENRGYQIDLVVNGDEKETVRNLGNIRNEIQNLTEMDYRSYKDSQNKLFEDILESVMGKELGKLESKEKRDYIQIIYEWLPDDAKKYIQDPIEIEKMDNINNEQKNNMEIGD